jgi:hypothetical protein
MKKAGIYKYLMYYMVFFIICGIATASAKDLNDVITNYKNYKNGTFTVEGKIATVVCRKPINFIMALSNSDDTSNDSKEYSLYYLSNGSDGVYIVSFKHFEAEQKAKLKAKLLITSEDEVDDKTEIMFNNYILKKFGVSLPGFDELQTNDNTSSANDLFLNDLTSELPMDQFWILLIDVG